MKTQFVFRVAAVALSGCSVFFSSGCSKSADRMTERSSSASPSPTASATASASPTISPLPTGSPFADVDVRLRDLETQMDNIFANTFRDFGSAFGQTGLGSSIDLREQKDNYVARVYVPNGKTQNVNARIENGALHVTTQSTESKNGASTSESSDEVVSLPQPVKADQMKIERKQNLVVITVPKTTTATAAASPLPSAAASPSPAVASSDWDDRMLAEMERMQTRMDEIFHNAFPNDLVSGTSMVRLGSTVNVDDQGDKYVVHFTLPRSDMSNVNVKFDNGRLSLSAKEEKSTTSNASPGTMSTAESGSYEQMITLPGPVKDADMKVERKNGAIVVTLPKA
jgi:HSP20 family molecular chaperone IbpA